MPGYIISVIILCLVILGFIPAMISANKGYHFLRWYLYGVALFPVAFIHSLLLKEPVYVMNVYSFTHDGKRKRKSYRTIAKAAQGKISFKYVAVVFLSKLVFGVLAGVVAYAIIRIFNSNVVLLTFTCSSFSVCVAVAMTITEIFRLSHISIIVDEMTKRALIMLVISVAVSVLMYTVKVVITNNVLQYSEFSRFVCTIVSFVGFLVLLLYMQRRYYRAFQNFFDYCTISLFSYVLFAAVMLVILSLSKKLLLISSVLSMPVQLFNFSYFSNVTYIEKIPTIYSAALVHGFVELLLLISGLQCRAYKTKERKYRVEYRSKAFRMSRKRALRRHISNVDKVATVPVK